jgi:diaminopimelate epimerase
VNVGNPHCIFFVDDLNRFDLALIGPRIEHDLLFPERVNVSLAQITAPDTVRLLVWERGAGLTQACGTAACAAAVAAIRKGLTGRDVAIHLPGGNLRIEWRAENGHILMTGPWQLDYEGDFEFARPALAS